MCAFTATNKVPDVYIDEIQLPGEIAGVSTNIAAIIGPAKAGPMNAPTRLTNLTQFREAFGVKEADGEYNPYFSPAVRYAPHAVEGFFRNGGTVCYFVRVGTGKQASLKLADRKGQPTITVTAKQPGDEGNKILVTIKDASLATAKAVKAEANLAGAGATKATKQAEVDDASKFRIGDLVLIEGGGKKQTATVTAADVAGKKLTFDVLTDDYAAGGTVRIADLKGQRFRVDDVTKVERGSHVKISDNAASEETVVVGVQRLDGKQGFVTLSGGLTGTFSMAVGPDVQVATLEFDLIVTVGGQPRSFPALAMDPRHSRHFAKLVQDDQVELSAADPPNPTPPPDNRPAVATDVALASGVKDEPDKLSSAHFQSGIDALEAIDEVSIVCIPDGTGEDTTVQDLLVEHCEKMQDRFAILDPRANLDVVGIQGQRDELESDRGYAALYYPWIEIEYHPTQDTTERIFVPPSGHIAGVFARVDEQKGVHTAPANEKLNGALRLRVKLNETEMGLLNESGVNVLRSIRGEGLKVWGARTIAKRTQWRYVNVRRLLLFIEESLQESTRAALFQPNNEELWGQLKRRVSSFLTRVWSTGALFGTTPQKAFNVRIDEELNPQSLRELGQLVIEVTLYPTTPAEFIVFRVIQQPGGPSVEE